MIPSYYRDIESAVLEGRRKERELIDLLEFALVVVTSDKAASILKSLEVKILGASPEAFDIDFMN